MPKESSWEGSVSESSRPLPNLIGSSNSPAQSEKVIGLPTRRSRKKLGTLEAFLPRFESKNRGKFWIAPRRGSGYIGQFLPKQAKTLVLFFMAPLVPVIVTSHSQLGT